MQIRFLVGLLFVAASALAEPIGYEGARHLLNRTGFGATDAEIREFAGLERREAVERLLAGARREAQVLPPAFVDDPFVPFYRFARMSAEERQREQRKRFEEGLALREWWLREMVSTPSPLTERMTLFWHGHFATSQQKVRSPRLMYRQNVLLRREALGNFATLLHDVARDPAMLIYLDNAGSRRQAPNENFAREVMELFTLGEGRYTESDVKEAARAFTGWSVDRETGTFVNRRAWHDYGDKRVLGKTGTFDGTDVLNVLLARPETAQFVAAKLWKEFVSPAPEAKELGRIAAAFRDGRYEVKPLLRALFLAEAFWAPENRGVLLKSPVELVVGTLRVLEIRPVDLRPAAIACATLGQNPFAPPNVKGWPGGEAWINSATLLARKQTVERLLASDERMEAASRMEPANGKGRDERLRRAMERGMATYRFDWEAWSAKSASGASLEKLLLAVAPAHPVPDDLEGVQRVRRLAGDPAYQLK
jgi:uncharacterized protein (DUF1800 family)